MEVAAGSWKRDTTHEEFIPEGRIWYFKRRIVGGGKGKGDGVEEVIMWDRKGKVDRVFGSGVTGVGDE